jgi:SAM-dependent methyltransferase
MVIKNISRPIMTNVNLICNICGCHEKPIETSRIRSNIRKYRDQLFEIWRCHQCASLQCESVPDYSVFYADYTLRQQKAGYFLNAWHSNILKRLQKAGLKPHHTLLDYGCSSGLFLDYLKKKGYKNGAYYDPYVDQFSDKAPLTKTYDFVFCLDVIEHDAQPIKLFQCLGNLLKKDGILCLETPNAAGIDLKNSEDFIHALHLPYHINILSKDALINMGRQLEMQPIKEYDNWYLDSWWPGTSRSFIEKFMKMNGNDMESAFEKQNIIKIMCQPKMIFNFFYGFFATKKKKDHMMILFKKTVPDKSF